MLSGMFRAALLVFGIFFTVEAQQRHAVSHSCDCDEGLLYCSVAYFGENFNYDTKPNKSGNQLISPFSLYQALLVLREGARGSTKTKLDTGLFYLKERKCQTPKFVNPEYQKILGRSKLKVINIATRLYIRKGAKVKKNFSSAIQKLYKSGIEQINFGKSNAAGIINKFVSKNTANKIKDIIKPDALSGNTQFVLVNAIHFKDQWEIPFGKHSEKQTFYLSNGKSKTVDMMTTVGRFGYRKTEATEILRLNFNTPGCTMVLMLPGDPNEDDIYDLLDPFQLKDIQVEVKLPKFKIDATHENVLKDLADMGIDLRSNVDFSDMSNLGVEISSIVQKTYIDVNEKGVEAAAATGRMSKMTHSRANRVKTIHDEAGGKCVLLTNRIGCRHIRSMMVINYVGMDELTSFPLLLVNRVVKQELLFNFEAFL